MSLPIGFFSPLPLPIMVPFMFMQSAAMALAFGSFFQYGKRKLSAMPNEEFNALTPEALTAKLMSNVNNMIPTVEQSFKQMEHLNIAILEAMAKYLGQGIDYFAGLLSGKTTIDTGSGNFNIGNIPSGLSEVSGLTALNDYLNKLNLDTGQQSAAAPIGPTGGPYTTPAPTGFTYPRNAGTFAGRTLRRAEQVFASMKRSDLTILWQNTSNRDLKLHVLGWMRNNPGPSAKTLADAPAAIGASGATGDTLKISTLFNELEILMATVVKTKRLWKSVPSTNTNSLRYQLAFRSATSKWLIKAKAYNRFVQSVRRANLTIDTFKSLSAGRNTAKT